MSDSPFHRVVDDLTGGCGCACHTGIGYNAACDHCQPSTRTDLDNPILHWPNDPTMAGCNQHCHLAEQAGADVRASSGATVAPAPAPSRQPSTREPRTAAGRALYEMMLRSNIRLADGRRAILAIEAEAAATSAPAGAEGLPAGSLDVDYAIRLQKVVDELVPGIRHDFGLEADRLLGGKR